MYGEERIAKRFYWIAIISIDGVASKSLHNICTRSNYVKNTPDQSCYSKCSAIAVTEHHRLWILDNDCQTWVWINIIWIGSTCLAKFRVDLTCDLSGFPRKYFSSTHDSSDSPKLIRFKSWLFRFNSTSWFNSRLNSDFYALKITLTLFVLK